MRPPAVVGDTELGNVLKADNGRIIGIEGGAGCNKCNGKWEMDSLPFLPSIHPFISLQPATNDEGKP